MDIFLCIIIPLIGTTIGSLMVFFLNEKYYNKSNNLLYGLAAGVMTAASIWSLLIPSIEMCDGIYKIIKPLIGIVSGFIIFFIIDKFCSKNNKLDKIFTSVTIHNIPEGLAIGCIISGAIFGSSIISIASCFSLALGVGIQNIPEGAIISVPSYNKTKNKFKSFMYGFLSGICEPIASIFAIGITFIANMILPFFLSFSSAIMIYVVIKELIPEIYKSKIGMIYMLIGFVLMMILDMTL